MASEAKEFIGYRPARHGLETLDYAHDQVLTKC